jgi:adenylyltransferase/sulfurtransferase
MAIVPRRTACFRCLFPQGPNVTRLETSETAGILAAAVVTVAAFQWTLAVKLLVGDASDTAGTLLTVDVWSGDYQVVHDIPRRAACPCCVDGVYEYLDARTDSTADPAEARSLDARRVGA